jgi:hypothetical protein
MNGMIQKGEPFWLSAYPNEGTLDYFGFRFYRQPNRKYLVRGAAANNFKNAKTLLYYGAISYGFRKSRQMDADHVLTEVELEEWKSWFQVANYLYVVSCSHKYGQVPDTGFIGAIAEAQNYFSPYIQSDTERFDILSTKERFYPPQREWGYLNQFWVAPLRYFRCVQDIASCQFGEYAKACYELFSSYEHWESFEKILSVGSITKKEFRDIEHIVECIDITRSEETLAKNIIFDESGITATENEEYRKNFRFIQSLLDNGFEGYVCSDEQDIAVVLSYMHLKNISISDVDLQWKMLVSSMMFEIGICRFYTLIAKGNSDTSIPLSIIKRAINGAIATNPIINSEEQSVSEVLVAWEKEYLKDIKSFSSLYGRLRDRNNFATLVDGVIAGFLLSDIDEDRLNSDVYDALTDNYHQFVPQAYFSRRKIDLEENIYSFLENIYIDILDQQYEFSLDRMNYGQKAKFIYIKSEFGDEYIPQISNIDFSESTGILDMIGACLKLWETAGI